LRVVLFLTGWVGFLLILAYEKGVVHGPVAEFFKHYSGRSRISREGFYLNRKGVGTSQCCGDDEAVGNEDMYFAI